MLRRKAEVFAPTDGVLYVASDTDARAERGADFADPSLLGVSVPLSYRQMRLSSRDVELADAMGCEVTAKVEVRSMPGLDTEADVSLGGKVYELSRVESRGRTSWLWLSEIACDGTCELLSSSVEYDELAQSHQIDNEPVSVHVRSVAPGLRRVATGGVTTLDGTLTLRLRACDYAGEPRVRRGGRTYSVASTENHGRWIDLKCRELGADRG